MSAETVIISPPFDEMSPSALFVAPEAGSIWLTRASSRQQRCFGASDELPFFSHGNISHQLASLADEPFTARHGAWQSPSLSEHNYMRVQHREYSGNAKQSKGTRRTNR